MVFCIINVVFETPGFLNGILWCSTLSMQFLKLVLTIFFVIGFQLFDNLFCLVTLAAATAARQLRNREEMMRASSTALTRPTKRRNARHGPVYALAQGTLSYYPLWPVFFKSFPNIIRHICHIDSNFVLKLIQIFTKYCLLIHISLRLNKLEKAWILHNCNTVFLATCILFNNFL